MGEELPPVVASVLLKYEQYMAGMDEIEDRNKRVIGSIDALDGSTDKASTGLKDVGATAEKTAGSLTTISGEADGASTGLDRVGEAGTAASAGLDETAASADRAAGALARTDAAGAGKGFEKIGEDAAGMGSKVTKGAKDVEKAEQDTETRSGGFSSKISSVFKHVGQTMGNWGIPFAGSVSNMGEKIDEAETKGKGFSQSLVQVGKTATVVGAALGLGIGAESIHMADKFDVASSQLDNAIKNVGGSVSQLKPRIEATYGSMARLGFNQREVVESMRALTISTNDPTKALEDEAAAADLARAKHTSLSAATQTLTKVYAGSTRALTQLGINIDVGTGKLKSIQSATESVKAAELAGKLVQEEVSSGKLKGAEASTRLEQADLKLSQAVEKLRQDQQATSDILNVVKQRTENAANAYGHTLAGEVAKAKAILENLAVTIGDKLIPIVNTMIGVIASATQFVLHHKEVLIALAALIAGPLTLAIAAFTVSKLVAFGNAWINVGKTVASFGSLVVNTIGRVIAPAFASQEADMAALAAQTTTETGQMALDFDKVGAQAGVMAGEVEAADTAMEAANVAAGASFTAMLGPIGLVAGALIALKGPAEEVWGALSGTGGPEGFGQFGKNLSSGGLQKSLQKAAGGKVSASASGVESEILSVALAHGLSANAAAALVGNAAQESSLNPGTAGGGLYQMSGYPAADSAGNAQQQTEKAIELMGSSVIARMNSASSASAAARIMEEQWEKPAGSQPGETATTNNRPHREQAAEEAAKKIEKSISGTVPTAATNAIKNTVSTASPTAAKEAIKQALDSAKARITELKSAFATGFSELAKTSEKLFKMMQLQGGIKAKELSGLERANELEQQKIAVAQAEEGLRKAQAGEGVKAAENELAVAKRKQQETEAAQSDAEAKLRTAEEEKKRGKGSVSSVESAQSGVESARGATVSARESTGSAEAAVGSARTSRAAEIVSAEQALNNTLYAQNVAALKRQAAAEEAAISKENQAKQAAFTTALNQLKTHLAHSKVSTEQAMKDIEKVLKKYGVTFGTVGKAGGEAWVKQFEAAIKKAAQDAGAISTEISADIKAGIKIPGLAVGGIVTSPTLAMIGEAGPEAVVPLNQFGGTAALGAGISPLPAASSAAGGKGGLTIGEINLYGPNATSAQFAQDLWREIRPMMVT